jgi:hypothetical protein
VQATACTFSNHLAISGGAIYNHGAGALLTVSDSTFTGNHADGFQGAAGGIFNDYGTVTVANSTFSGNGADQQGVGGAIYNRGILTLTNSSFSGNSAAFGAGGAIFTSNYGVITVTNSTISGNTAQATGGFYLGADGVATLRNTIIANNRPGGNCGGFPITDGGGNLSWPGTTCPGINADPLLRPLQDNGGPTWTMAPGPGSGAIDAGIDAICAGAPVNSLDQRGVPRPQGSHCDIGAVEQHPYWSLWFPAARAQ